MSVRNIWNILRRDVSMGPRTMLVVWLFVFPLLITFLVRLVFGGLIDPSPRLGIVDLGSSSIPALVSRRSDIDVSMYSSIDTLKQKVESDNLDAGLVLPKGFDQAVRSGGQPDLKFYVGGQSLASTRVILGVTTLDMIRDVAGAPAPVKVVTETIGSGPSVPIQERLVPILVLVAVALAGIFLPAAMLIQERIQRTADAVLSTPLTVTEYFFARGLLSFVLALGIGVLTLLINGGFTKAVAGNVVVLAVGALMSVQIGLMLGATVKDLPTMFSIWKSGGIILFAPAVLFLFPSVPQWIARIFPTYYFLGPLYNMTVNGEGLSGVYIDLIIGVAISVVLAIIVAPLARRMEQRLGMA